VAPSANTIEKERRKRVEATRGNARVPVSVISTKQ
jgi:hypothetical protein